MKLFTEIQLKKHDMTFESDTVITGIGSCFAEYVMEQLQASGFKTGSNPNGIVYNMHSITESLEHVIRRIPYGDRDFIFYNNFWHSWEHHGSFSALSKEGLSSNISSAADNFRNILEKAGIFILTPASSVIYRLEESNRIVANCHKYPGNKFRREILGTDDNCRLLKKSITMIREINPLCLIIITLSPVRHYPGDLVLNARSKANLLSSIHHLIDETENTVYFPSYEIFLDELRDYRFCREDMLHPGPLAREIIFGKFIGTFFSEKCKTGIELSLKSMNRNNHYPHHN